jgi:hypothetical protein
LIINYNDMEMTLKLDAIPADVWSNLCLTFLCRILYN